MLTIPGNPLDLSRCGACLALLIADAAGIRSAIRERWTVMNKRTAAQRDKQRVKLERVAKMDKGNGRGVRRGF